MKRQRNPLQHAAVYAAVCAALAATLLLPGCKSSSKTAVGLSAHEPDWQIMGLALTAKPELVKKAILRRWPNAQFETKTPLLTGTGTAQVPGALLLLVRPSSAPDNVHEELAVQFNYSGHIVFIEHGRTYPFAAAPPEDAFLKGFSRQYAPGVDSGSANPTYYSGPSGVIHQAAAFTDGYSSFGLSETNPIARVTQPQQGQIDLEPHSLSFSDDLDRQPDHEVIQIQSWRYNLDDRLYGYAVELENQAAWQAWQAEQQTMRQRVAEHLGEAYQGTQY